MCNQLPTQVRFSLTFDTTYPAKLIGSFSFETSVASTERIISRPFVASFSRILSNVAPVAFPTNRRGTNAFVAATSIRSALGMTSSNSSELTTMIAFAPPKAAKQVQLRTMTSQYNSNLAKYRWKRERGRTLITLGQKRTHAPANDDNFPEDRLRSIRFAPVLESWSDHW